MGRKTLISLLFSLLWSAQAGAVENWTDQRLPVKENLELWLDASRENEARESLGLRKVASQGPLDIWHDGSGRGRHLRQRLPEARPRLRINPSGTVVNFDGKDDFVSAANLNHSFRDATVFIFAAPRSNRGLFRAFLALNQSGRNDYTTGLTIDLGPAGSSRFESLNPEGSGFGGVANLLKTVSALGSYHLLAVTSEVGSGGTRLYLDGKAQGQRDRMASVLFMDELTVGARCFSNTPEPPHTQGFLDGNIAEVLIYSRVLSESERAQVEKYLAAKHAGLPDASAEAASPADGTPLVTVPNPPPVQMLVPGFTVRELPVALDNINNVKYRPDGKLVALGYNGRIYLLSDTNGDGLEDKVSLFWDQPTLRAPIGLALTPPGYKHGQGVFTAAKGKLALIVDTNGDEIADRETILAEGWKELPHGVDALGVALDPEGNVYFGLGTANFTDGYLRDNTGSARFNLNNERGTILKVSPDFQKRELVATGIRFPVALAFNRLGDLFCTDQEGATWMANGNPLDELLHIQLSPRLPPRHYGFPPRHPKHLPSVIDEPSVFDYAPQHQSTCGLNFNESVQGGPSFGLSWWAGDALVAGYSRGKLYRTKLVKTSAGYVAQNQLIACLQMLAADACVSPQGDLVVAAHSGQPDWGSGPNGQGKLYKISHTLKDAPQPLVVWEASPTETRIAFDRPLDPAQLRNLARQASITRGKYVAAGDRFESLRPGYQAVQDQIAEPRHNLPVLSASVSRDHRTIILTKPPQTAAANYALTLPGLGRPEKASAGELPQHAAIDLLSDLTGVEARWTSENGKTNWSGWLPHLDSTVAKALTQGSSDHEQLWSWLQNPGTLVLRGQLDLWQMLQPAVQPGSKLDFVQPEEEVFMRITSGSAVALEIKARAHSDREETARLTTFSVRPREGQWLPFELKFTTSKARPDWKVHWWTALDSRERALPLRRILLPWATPVASPPPGAVARNIPELAGGHWVRGKRLFFGDQAACSKCHSVRGQGGKVGPDLSNLIHRDYASVLRDILDPNATVNPDHLAYHVELKNGEAISGVLQEDKRDQIVLGDASGKPVVVPRTQIAALKLSTLSLMPEGIGQALNSQQLKDLLTFLLTAPLEPAPLEIPGEPPPRTWAEMDAVLKDSAPLPKELKPLQIVLAAGPKDHGPGEHDYPLWQQRWEKLLPLADGVKVTTAFGWPAPEHFRSADVIVFYSNNPGWSAERAADLDAFLNRGGGLVYLHYAVDGHKHVEELSDRIGLAWRGGASRFRHGPVSLRFHSHPLALGFEKAGFIDESYWQLIGQESRIQLLASGLEEGSPKPLFWTRQQGEGRVFVSILGHYTWTFDDPLFRLLVLRGIAWSAHQPMDRLAELATIGARIGQ